MRPSHPRLLAVLVLAVVVVGLLVARPWGSTCNPDQAVPLRAAEVDGSTLLVTYVGSVPSGDGCDVCAGIEIDESASELVATVRVGGEEAGQCNDLGREVQATLSLVDVLGDRPVRDGFNGQIVDVAPG